MQTRAPMRTLVAAMTAAAGLSILTGVAGASTFTVGSDAVPAGAIASDAAACTAVGLAAQTAGASGVLFSTPAGGQITQWQTNTSGQPANAAGEPITLVALAPQSGAYRVDASDTQTLPNPLPASGVATFTPASPMMVAAGDVLGLAGSTNSPNITCAWISTGHGNGGGTLLDQGLLMVGSPLSPGDVFSPLTNGSLAVTVSATLVATEDSAVTTAVKPAAATAGSAVLLASTVTNAGPAENTLTFTDAVPPGLTIDAAVSPAGACSTTAGQVVTCTLSGLGAGQSAPVDIVVTPRAGTYTNRVTVAQPSAATDPVTTNNAAKATFTVGKLIVPKCVVTGVTKLPLGTARKLLTALDCKVGKVTKSPSSTVAKGDVIKTRPGKGSFAAGKVIAIVESSGPKPEKSKKHT
jgi:uncharacterized repeat protein (TIGR01451 family)